MYIVHNLKECTPTPAKHKAGLHQAENGQDLLAQPDLQLVVLLTQVHNLKEYHVVFTHEEDG